MRLWEGSGSAQESDFGHWERVLFPIEKGRTCVGRVGSGGGHLGDIEGLNLQRMSGYIQRHQLYVRHACIYAKIPS